MNSLPVTLTVGVEKEHKLPNAPLISIITVVFNGAATLRQTIDSIIPNISDEVEYLIIDGGSTDGTVDIIRQYEDYLAYWVSEPDQGIYDAWNKAIGASNGKYLSFVGADDILEEGALELYVRHTSESPEIEYWSSLVAFGDRQGQLLGKPWDWRTFRRFMTVAHVGSLHCRSLYIRHGMYNSSYRIAGDYEFLLRAGPTLRAGFFPEVTAIMGKSGISNNQILKALRETRHAKISTRACSQLLANFDFMLAVAKKLYSIFVVPVLRR